MRTQSSPAWLQSLPAHRFLILCTLLSSFSLFMMPPTMAQSSSTPSPQPNQGFTLQVPPLHPPSTRLTWQKQRSQIRKTLIQLLGDFPPRPKVPTVQITQRESFPGYTRESFQFNNGLGMSVPGYLLIPTASTTQSSPSQPRPAVLYCHWHGGQYDIGKEELFGTNATPVPPGPALARAGYVVLAIDAACFGKRQGIGPAGATDKGGAGEMTASKFQLWFGRSLWGVIVRDDLMALDYLCSRPEVDPKRIAVTGISMGSTRSWWIMGLDDRPKTLIGVGCLTRYQDLIAQQGLKYHGIYYFVPGMLKHFDTESVIALSAPRPTLFMTGSEDAGSPTDGIRTIDRLVRPVYKLWDADAQFQNVIYPGIGHLYTPEMWQETLKWLQTQLTP